jgi:hypothetical protein
MRKKSDFVKRSAVVKRYFTLGYIVIVVVILMTLLGHYVSPRGLGNLKSYKYSGVDNSLVAKYVMQPFWTRLVELLPKWMA